MNTATFKPWLGGVLSKFVSGMAHGALIGSGTGAIVTTAEGRIPSHHEIILTAIISLLSGGLKDVWLYIENNPLPDLFSNPIIAPIPGPVATPTVSDQPSTLAQPIATTKT